MLISIVRMIRIRIVEYYNISILIELFVEKVKVKRSPKKRLSEYKEMLS